MTMKRVKKKKRNLRKEKRIMGREKKEKITRESFQWQENYKREKSGKWLTPLHRSTKMMISKKKKKKIEKP